MEREKSTYTYLFFDVVEDHVLEGDGKMGGRGNGVHMTGISVFRIKENKYRACVR